MVNILKKIHTKNQKPKQQQQQQQKKKTTITILTYKTNQNNSNFLSRFLSVMSDYRCGLTFYRISPNIIKT